jgi:hypothetical protein
MKNKVDYKEIAQMVDELNSNYESINTRLDKMMLMMNEIYLNSEFAIQDTFLKEVETDMIKEKLKYINGEGKNSTQI